MSLDNKITLRGTIGSLRERRKTKKAAQRLFSMISVDWHQPDVHPHENQEAAVAKGAATRRGRAWMRASERG